MDSFILQLKLFFFFNLFPAGEEKISDIIARYIEWGDEENIADGKLKPFLHYVIYEGKPDLDFILFIKSFKVIFTLIYYYLIYISIYYSIKDLIGILT